MTRDPTIDPQPGDVVRSTTSKGVRERHVTSRTGNDVYYDSIEANGRPARSRLCFISTWQEWCRANKVRVSRQSAW